MHCYSVSSRQYDLTVCGIPSKILSYLSSKSPYSIWAKWTSCKLKSRNTVIRTQSNEYYSLLKISWPPAQMSIYSESLTVSLQLENVVWLWWNSWHPWASKFWKCFKCQHNAALFCKIQYYMSKLKNVTHPTKSLRHKGMAVYNMNFSPSFSSSSVDISWELKIEIN